MSMTEEVLDEEECLVEGRRCRGWVELGGCKEEEEGAGRWAPYMLLDGRSEDGGQTDRRL